MTLQVTANTTSTSTRFHIPRSRLHLRASARNRPSHSPRSPRSRTSSARTLTRRRSRRAASRGTARSAWSWSAAARRRTSCSAPRRAWASSAGTASGRRACRLVICISSDVYLVGACLDTYLHICISCWSVGVGGCGVLVYVCMSVCM